MTYQHAELASGRWNELSLVEQLGNVGSEVDRAIKWKGRGNSDSCMKAFYRGLELLDLTLACPANRHRLREIARTREVLVDFFYGENEFSTTGESLRFLKLESENFALRIKSKAGLGRGHGRGHGRSAGDSAGVEVWA